MQKEDTIAAVSTPQGTGGIAVVRVSGKDAVMICGKIFKPAGKKELKDASSHTLQYGRITDPETGGQIDEGMAAVMLAPRSFTTEDTVEINCHGGMIVTREVLSCVLRAGARLAEPGEFTKRAFLGGRLDLSQAEAVIDIINSKTKTALQSSNLQLRGRLSEKINQIRDSLLTLSAKLNAMVDYPEDDIDELTMPELTAALSEAEQSLSALYQTAHTGRLVRDGIQTVILGKPNVGKSSLLNVLSGDERAIVTEIAGTTRDVITEYIDIGGVALNICDTAGIRNGADHIERIGIEKSKEYVENADLVLLLFDAASGLSQDDSRAAAIAKGKTTIAVINKTDAGDKVTEKSVKDQFGYSHTISISARENRGLDKLRQLILELFQLGSLSAEHDLLLSNLRHQESVRMALDAVRRAIKTLHSGIPIDMLSVDLLSAVSALGEVSGKTVNEEMVDRIFQQFCLGK